MAEHRHVCPHPGDLAASSEPPHQGVHPPRPHHTHKVPQLPEGGVVRVGDHLQGAMVTTQYTNGVNTAHSDVIGRWRGRCPKSYVQAGG